MVEIATRRSNMDGLNYEEKYKMCEFLLQRTSYRNCRLTVENKNLKNKLKNMEYEICEVKKALSVEDFQCNLLTEQLDLKLKQWRQFRIREEKLCNKVDSLQSALCKERLANSVLNERLKQVTLKKTPLKALNQWLSRVIGRLRRAVRRGRNSVADVRKLDS